MLSNIQAPEPLAHDPQYIDFHSMFYTLQGEGPHIGKPSLFIRLAGCNLQCPLCDTEYTQGREKLLVGQIISRARAEIDGKPVSLIVITGGEPTRQPLYELLWALLNAFERLIQIESNGVLDPEEQVLQMIREGSVDYVVSPKTGRVCNSTRYATAFKYVIDHTSVRREDGLPILALGHKANPYIARPPLGYGGEVFVSPADVADEQDNRANLIAARDSALKFGYRLTVQLHKLVGIA